MNTQSALGQRLKAMAEPITWEHLQTLAATDTALYGPLLAKLQALGLNHGLSFPAVLAANIGDQDGEFIIFLPFTLACPLQAQLEAELEDEQVIARELQRLLAQNKVNAIRAAVTSSYRGVKL